MNWNNELQDCTTTERVLDVVNEFLAQQDPAYWAAVPAAAHPEEIAAPADIHRWHHALVAQLRRARPVPMELQELCVLFLRASVRLHQLDLRELERRRASNDELGCAPAVTRARGR